jgi:hypothetical protein
MEEGFQRCPARATRTYVRVEVKSGFSDRTLGFQFMADLDAPRIRHAAIPADAVVVVRGVADIEPETSIRQATLFRRRFSSWGRFGLSAFYARSDDEIRDLGEDRLASFAVLSVYEIADLLVAGFEVVPTYRSPHVTIAFYDDVERSIERLRAIAHRTVVNVGYRKEDS